MDSTTDVSSLRGFSADLTLMLSPLGAHYESGPRVRVTASVGRYRYSAGSERALSSTGVDTSGDLLLGYGFAFERGFLLATAGPTINHSEQRPGDGSPVVTTVRHGAKAVVSFYGNPTDETMLYSQAWYSTISTSYYLQAKAGAAIRPRLFVGPELTLSGGTGFGQWRLGAHVSGMRVGWAHLGLSVGFVDDRNLGRGAYVGTSFLVIF